MPDISNPHMAMLVLLSHFRDIDGLIGEVETCSKLLQLWPTQEQKKKKKNPHQESKEGGEERERGERMEMKKHKHNGNVFYWCYIDLNLVKSIHWFLMCNTLGFCIWPSTLNFPLFKDHIPKTWWKWEFYYNQRVTRMQFVYFANLQSNLFIHSDRPVAEGDGIAEASLSLDGPLGHVHNNLWALGAGVKEQRKGGRTPTWLVRQATLRLVVVSVWWGRKWPIQRIYMGKDWSACLVSSTRGEQEIMYSRISDEMAQFKMEWTVWALSHVISTQKS